MVLGGTGAIGGAAAARLAGHGWRVQVTGREPARMPPDLAMLGVAFHAVDRADTHAIEALVGEGVDLLVDALAFCSDDVRGLIPVMSAAGSVVLVSSRAVYADQRGRHVNGPEAPVFDGPIREDQRTVPAAGDGTDPFSRAGYGPSKVAAERTALDSGLPVTVLRPAKVHGPWARNPRTAVIARRMLAGAPAIALADRGASIDHLTASANAAALIEAVANAPGPRILNIADPDTPTAAEIVSAIATELRWDGLVDLLEPGEPGGEHPWHTSHPIVLDTTAALEIGYRPVNQGIALLAEEVRWFAADHASTGTRQLKARS